MDWSALTDAELTTMLANCQTHINRILTGAQAGTIGSGRTFQMANLKDLRQTFSELSEEKRRRGESGGDLILAQFGSPQ